ncbi:MAG: pirin family protein [Nitrospirae bacterium]|nr:pirin family protein [Nitrospirota bacterium]
MRLRRAKDRGATRFDWLTSHHSFAFGDYHDPQWLGWSALRVLNDDHVVPGGGFGAHAHKNMEIVTYVVSGAIAHQDSMGNETRLNAGELQRMSAGTGITHSEYNASPEEPLHFFQIWITPDSDGTAPEYEQTRVEPITIQGHFQAVVTPDGRGRTLSIHQDAFMYLARLRPGTLATRTIEAERVGYLHVISGLVRVGRSVLSAGDGACLTDGGVSVRAVYDAHVMLFDLP